MDKLVPLQIPASLQKYMSLVGGSLKFIFETQENINPEHITQIIKLQNKVGWLSFNVEMIEAEDLINLPKIDMSKYDETKSPAERLRAVLFRVHESKGGKPDEFDDYYKHIMEKLINMYKEKLA